MADPRTFEFSVPEGRTPEQVLAQARTQARTAGIAMVGDAVSGSFQGMAAGTYTVEGRLLKVEVTKKPGILPWGMVESTLRKLFA